VRFFLNTNTGRVSRPTTSKRKIRHWSAIRRLLLVMSLVLLFKFKRVRGWRSG